MLKIVIRKSDKKPMPEDAPWRDDSPNHRPGIMEAAIARKCGGSASDYEGILIPDKSKMLYMTAKTLKWDNSKKRLKAIPFSGKEKKAKQRKQERSTVEHELIMAQMYIDTAEDLGIDVADKKAEHAALRTRHEELKDG